MNERIDGGEIAAKTYTLGPGENEKTIIHNRNDFELRACNTSKVPPSVNMATVFIEFHLFTTLNTLSLPYITYIG